MEKITIAVPGIKLPIDSEKEACVMVKYVKENFDVIYGRTNITSCQAEKMACFVGVDQFNITRYDCREAAKDYDSWQASYTCPSLHTLGFGCGGIITIDAATGNWLEELLIM